MCWLRVFAVACFGCPGISPGKVVCEDYGRTFWREQSGAVGSTQRPCLRDNAVAVISHSVLSTPTRPQPSSHLQFDKRDEQITNGCRLLSPGHLRGLIEVRMFAKLPALKRVVEEIHSDDFRGDENRFGMFAANDDARTREEPCRVKAFPKLSG